MIVTLSLSHCSTMDIVNVGAGIYGGMEKKLNPVGAVRMLIKKSKKDE